MKPSEKLAQSLEVLHNLQKQDKYAIQSKETLPQMQAVVHLFLLVKNALI